MALLEPIESFPVRRGRCSVSMVVIERRWLLYNEMMMLLPKPSETDYEAYLRLNRVQVVRAGSSGDGMTMPAPSLS